MGARGGTVSENRQAAMRGARPGGEPFSGLGLLGFGTGALLRLYRAGALRLMASMLRRPGAYLLVENSDDLALLRARGVDPGARFAILGGAGVDPQAFPALPPPGNDVPIAAFVGRMIRPKGIDVLMQAY